MVAAKRADVSCVIALASPTDLRSVRAQGRIEVQSGGAPAALLENSARVSNIAVSAFGRRRQRAYSPVAHAARINARLLLATAANDVVMPQGQAQALANAVTATHAGAHADVMRLEAGGDAFVHGGATASAKHDFDSHAASLVAPFGRAPVDAGEPKPQRESNPLSTFLNSIFGIFSPRR
jgi:dienelactone hydrolase